MKIKTLTGIGIDELLGTFNESFSDYSVPLQLTIDQLRGKLKTEKVDLSLSAGSFVDEKLVGFILHGFDIIDNKRNVYNAGTGVIPSERNKGLTKQMYDFILPVLRKENIESLVLEVISSNLPAIKSYEKVGFNIERKLLCYRGIINPTCDDNITTRKVNDYDWQTIKTFWDIAPSWQNSAGVMEILKDTNVCYGAFKDNQLIGYIIFNPLNKRVQQIGVDKHYRRMKTGSTLLGCINEPGANITIINVEEGGAINEFLLACGLEVFVEQLEMKLDLN